MLTLSLTLGPNRVMNDIDYLNPRKRNDNAPKSVDEQVAPEHDGCSQRAIFDARNANGINATMISALKTTADKSPTPALIIA